MICPHHANRLAQRVGVEVGARHVRHRKSWSCALDLGGPAGHVVEHVRGQRHVGRPRDGERLAVVQRLELRELVQVLEDQVADPPDDPAALGRASSGATGRPRTPGGRRARPGRCPRLPLRRPGRGFRPWRGWGSRTIRPDAASAHCPLMNSCRGLPRNSSTFRSRVTVMNTHLPCRTAPTAARSAGSPQSPPCARLAGPGRSLASQSTSDDAHCPAGLAPRHLSNWADHHTQEDGVVTAQSFAPADQKYGRNPLLTGR